MTSTELRQKFVDFFSTKGHKVMPSSSLIPEGDPTVLFTTAGMQQFKPYYAHPEDALKDLGSVNIATIQKCIRTGDIDEVGDDTHLTFFEMLGNFSFGGYWKREAIGYAHEFITKELNLKIDYVTVFSGENNIPEDTESAEIWKSLGITDIRKEGMKDVFWGPTGDEGPCGPTTEIYVNGVEIWNIVFNEYYKSKDGTYTKLEKPGIDTGMGLERLLAILNNKKSVYETDFFNGENTRDERIASDHVKAALFLITEGIMPSNSGQGYVLRRLIRRAVRFSKKPLSEYIDKIVTIYSDTYTNILEIVGMTKRTILDEEKKFRETLEKGIKEFEKGKDPFVLYTTYGFPFELALELAKEKGIKIDEDEFKVKMTEHQKLSQTASAGMFKGGLADHEPKTIKLHTAHHLLLAALQEVLGKSVKQRGSNITQERMRIDFAFERKLTDEEKKKVEEIVNTNIQKRLKVIHKELPKSEAESLGAEMEFGAKYGDVVSVYLIENEKGNIISKEFCGGPHVNNTNELGHFKILKEEASSQGVRRIKATLE